MQHAIYNLMRVLKWPVATVCLIGIPSGAMHCWNTIRKTLTDAYVPFWFGIAIMTVLWLVWIRKTKWAQFLSTMEHEAVHAIVGLISFIPIKELKVNANGSGHVKFSPPTHWLMLLAPYFIPISLIVYTAILLTLHLPLAWRAGLMGAIFGFEGAGKLRAIHPRQTDFKEAGYVFTILFLPFAILLCYGSVFSVVAEGALEPGWHFATIMVTSAWHDTARLFQTALHWMIDT